MNLLLIACYELGHQPLSLASPLAWLAHAGYTAQTLDLSLQELDPAAVQRANVVALAVPMLTALRLGEQAARRIRHLNPHAHICFYGHYAWLNKDQLLKIGDSVIAGEYEAALVNLIKALDQNDHTPIEGVTTRTHAAEPQRKRLTFVTPHRQGLPPLNRYAHYQHGSEHRIAGYTETTRGCLHTCAHCPLTPVYQGRFFVIPAEVVLADIRQQVQAGAAHITFGDPDFLNAPKHAQKITRAVHQEFPQLTFDFTAKIEHLIEHQRLLPEFKNYGCSFIVSAVESFSDTVLAKLKKGHTRDQVLEALALTRAVGITVRPSLVAFTPWTSLEDYLELLESVSQLNLVECLDPIQFAIRLLVPPHSALEGAFAWGALDPENYSYTWAHPDPRMDELYEAVSARVAQGAAQNETAPETFLAIRTLAYNVAGLTPPEAAGFFTVTPIPRLSEAWFC